MVGRKQESKLRTERVVVHVTAIEKEKIKELAEENGVDVSTLIRSAIIYKKFNQFFKE